MLLVHNAEHSEEFWALHNHSRVPAAAVFQNWPASIGTVLSLSNYFPIKSWLLLITPGQ